MKTDERMVVILRIHEKTCQRLSESPDPLLLHVTPPPPTPAIEIRASFLTVGLCLFLNLSESRVS